MQKKKCLIRCELSTFCGATRNRTGDTRIFSPLLYQLSYGTLLCFTGAKLRTIFETTKFFGIFFEKNLRNLIYNYLTICK